MLRQREKGARGGALSHCPPPHPGTGGRPAGVSWGRLSEDGRGRSAVPLGVLPRLTPGCTLGCSSSCPSAHPVTPCEGQGTRTPRVAAGSSDFIAALRGADAWLSGKGAVGPDSE